MKEDQLRAMTVQTGFLLDFKDIIIHVFDKESRSFYDLERIWRDGKEVTEEDLKSAE